MRSVEEIFSLGLNTGKLGRLNASAYWVGDSVILLNSDNTLLVKYWGLSPERPDEAKFYIKDYEGSKISMKDKEVVFFTEGRGYSKRKCCRPPEKTFSELNSFLEEKEIENAILVLSDSILSFLDTSLSHTEILLDKKGPLIVQRDIYTGQRIEIYQKSSFIAMASPSSGSFSISSNNFEKEIKIAVRTLDLESLFLANNQIELSFGSGYAWAQNPKGKFCGMISNCIYDSLGELAQLVGTSEVFKADRMLSLRKTRLKKKPVFKRTKPTRG